MALTALRSDVFRSKAKFKIVYTLEFLCGAVGYGPDVGLYKDASLILGLAQWVKDLALL